MVLYVFAENFRQLQEGVWRNPERRMKMDAKKLINIRTITKNKKITDVQIEEVKKNCKEERSPKWTGQKLKLHYVVTNRNLQKTKTAETPTHV